MKAQAIRDTLDAMAKISGVRSCALVEVEAGMVWHHAGSEHDAQNFAEAASDYWRLYRRLAGQFETLGELKASVLVHARGRLTLLPCGRDMLLFALTHNQSPPDWRQWQEQARQLAVLVNQM